MRNLFLTNRFFWCCGGLALAFVLGFAFPAVFPLAQAAGLFFLVLLALDILLLYSRDLEVSCTRTLPKIFGLGDDNPVHLEILNSGRMPLACTLIEELPVQFQIRDFERKLALPPGQPQSVGYTLRPTTRGGYTFGVTHLYLSGIIGLVERRLKANNEPAEVPVYPSVLQMKQMELKAFDRISTHQGIKKIRRIGHSYEFEQIKNYVRGDDYRSVNWKASSRKGELMVNQYEDERAQQLYCIIDKSRVMRLPFKGLSLMDYAINSTLAISNIALQKYDKAGLITFSDKLGAVLKADSKPNQLSAILNQLYKEEERPLEANYELLFFAARKLISGRSMILLFTNFESMYALERVLPSLRRINHVHLLVVVLFENTEVWEFAEQAPQTLEGIYQQTTAQKFLAEKRQMVQKLRQFGIQTIYTKPEELSIHTVNKYLELKSRGMI